MKFGLSKRDLDRIQETFNQFPQVQSAILFGSRAMGNFKKGSDVDIALKGDITHATVIGCKSILNEEIPIPYFFDVIDYASIENRDLLRHIREHGKIIFQKLKK